VKGESGIGFGGGAGGDLVLLAVARHRLAGNGALAVLTAHRHPVDFLMPERPNRPQDIHLLVTDIVGIKGNRRFHRHQAQDLEKMILHHVAQGASLVVIVTALFHPHGFSHSDLHLIDIAPVPDGLEERVGKAEGKDILYRFLAEIMIDPVNL